MYTTIPKFQDSVALRRAVFSGEAVPVYVQARSLFKVTDPLNGTCGILTENGDQVCVQVRNGLIVSVDG